MKRVEELKAVLVETYTDVNHNPMDLIQLIAENMALSRCIMDGSTPVALIEKCNDSPLTKRLKEAGLW